MRAKQPLLYVAIGDSLTRGVGAFFGPGFVFRYIKMTEQILRKKVLLHRFGKNGATTSQILDMIQHPLTERAIQYANIITITAGGNDLIDAEELYFKTDNEIVFEESLYRAKNNLSLMIDHIVKLKNYDLNHVMINIVNLYNPTPFIYETQKWIQSYNYFLLEKVTDHIQVADAYSAFYGRTKQLLSFDHIHPNKRGYQAIAQSLTNIGYNGLFS